MKTLRVLLVLVLLLTGAPIPKQRRLACVRLDREFVFPCRGPGVFVTPPISPHPGGWVRVLGTGPIRFRWVGERLEFTLGPGARLRGWRIG